MYVSHSFVFVHFLNIASREERVFGDVCHLYVDISVFIPLIFGPTNEFVAGGLGATPSGSLLGIFRVAVYTIYIQLKILKREDTNSSYEEPKPQGAKRRPDAKKGGAKPPHPVNPFRHF